MNIASEKDQKSCSNCNKTGLYALAWILYVVILVPAFLWSSQVLTGSHGPEIEEVSMSIDTRFEDIDIMRHQEYHSHGNSNNYKDWILNSNVCPLGKFVFYFVVLMYFAYLITILFISENNSKILSYTVLGITIIIYICMLMSNMPFAIRSIPAFLAAGGIVTIGLLAKPTI